MERIRLDIVFTNERIIPASGLSVVGGMLTKSSLVKWAEPDTGGSAEERRTADQERRQHPDRNWRAGTEQRSPPKHLPVHGG